MFRELLNLILHIFAKLGKMDLSMKDASPLSVRKGAEYILCYFAIETEH